MTTENEMAKPTTSAPVPSANEDELGGYLFMKFDNPGDTLEGVFEGIDTFSYRETGNEGTRLLFKRGDDERVAIIAYAELNEKMKGVATGTRLRIVYQGKRNLPGAKTMRQFRVFAQQ